jgi:hypothetical protein
MLEKLLPMASGPKGFCSGGGQARLGRSRGKGCKCVCARGCAPPGEGPAGAATGGGRAAPLLPLPASRSSAGPAHGGALARAGYLPPMPRGRGGGRGPAAPRAPLFLPLALRFLLVVGGAVTPARSPGAIESGLSAGAQRLGLSGGSAARRQAQSPPAGTAAAAMCVAPSRRRVRMERGSVEGRACGALPRWLISPLPGRRAPATATAPAGSRPPPPSPPLAPAVARTPWLRLLW